MDGEAPSFFQVACAIVGAPTPRPAGHAGDIIATLLERSEPELNTGCRLWTGELSDKGYGRIWIGGQRQRAHRVAWEAHFGPIPEGMLVCHSCDTPACVNPDHLWVGTVEENNADKLRKGRAATGPRIAGRREPGAIPYVGVTWSGERYQARFTHGGVRRCLGNFETAEAAARAYDDAAAAVHGEAARQNFPRQRAEGGTAAPSPPQAFPDQLEALARELADEMRMSGTYNGLLDLIERAKDERDGAKPNTPPSIIAGSVLGATVDLQLGLDAVIDRLARRAAIAEAQRLDEELADIDTAAERDAEFNLLRPAQRAAVVWAQACSIAARLSLTTAIGESV
ncbi:MAG: HNH endonuclease signature motif containing protein [Pseudomonadota bacterium]